MAGPNQAGIGLRSYRKERLRCSLFRRIAPIFKSMSDVSETSAESLNHTGGLDPGASDLPGENSRDGARMRETNPYLRWGTPPNPGSRVWTDDYSNLLSVLKW